MKKLFAHIRPATSLFLLFLGTLGTTGSAQGQLSPADYDFPQNHLPWYTIESDHFLVHFQEGNSRSAQVASRVAEEIYPHITELYGLEPDSRVSIILTDRQDYSNGAAYFFDNQIRIWVPPLQSPLRGTSSWLRDVITHEFIHIVQLQASMKKSRRLPAIYLQWLSYEDVRRPDVLYGYPKGLITHPFASVSVPAWFAEGTAQYQRSGWFYDTWDTHRDMLLRSAILEDRYLSLTEMGSFASMNSLQREQLYNQGFALVTFLVENYGEEIVADISDAFARPGVHTADEALLAATGTPANQLFDRWVQDRKKFYEEATATIRPQALTFIEKEGFFNFHPRFTPSGSKLAYLSNKGRDESRTSLYIKNLENGELVSGPDLGSQHTRNDPHNFCHYAQKPAIDQIQSGFSFSPDGNRVVFTRQKLNTHGESYNDLYIYHLDSATEQRITKSARLSSPAWHPEKDILSAIVQDKGTQNLVRVNTKTGEITPLTHFENGEQLFTPVWHPSGKSIFFAWANRHGRDIKQLNLKTGAITDVLVDSAVDYRDPSVGPKGLYLYYAADHNGIFNIYRKGIDSRLESGEQLTNVTGGAFMPSVSKDGTLIFADYSAGGYKIASLKLDNILAGKLQGSYQPNLHTFPLNDEIKSYPDITNYDDSELAPLSNATLSKADTGRVSISVNQKVGEENRLLYEYQETFTSLSFYPVVRFDNYTEQNGDNGRLLRKGRLGPLGKNLLRDLKIGTYISSREVIDRLSIYGGALFGIGSRNADGIGDFFSPSRLSDLDRDLFLNTEYRGLPFIEKRWSPTIALELNNLRRNVDNGLFVEEFPCTSCLPDTLRADIAYNVWEGSLHLRSKINHNNLVEVGIGYTPYRVQTEGFFSRELQQFVPSSSTEYFRGTSLSVSHVFESFKPYRHHDVAPIGLRTFFKYTFENAKLLEEYEVEDGILSPVYQNSKNHTVELNTRLGFPVSRSFNHTGQLYSRFFSYLNDQDDSFYLDYIGGFTGMRSYPFFALGGTTTVYGQFSYILPIASRLNRQLGRYTLDKLFLRLFAEVGSAWNTSLTDSRSLKTGVGSELRFALNSHYLFPLKLFVSTSYGFNQFDVTLPEEFITETPTASVRYGRELLFHFGLTFDFNILNHE